MIMMITKKAEQSINTLLHMKMTEHKSSDSKKSRSLILCLRQLVSGTIAALFHCSFLAVFCVSSLLAFPAFLSWEQREKWTVRLMTSASNTLYLPLYVYLLLCESRTAATGMRHTRRTLATKSNTHIFGLSVLLPCCHLSPLLHIRCSC